jgi:hypothetical protein
MNSTIYSKSLASRPLEVIGGVLNMIESFRSLPKSKSSRDECRFVFWYGVLVCIDVNLFEESLSSRTVDLLGFHVYEHHVVVGTSRNKLVL